MPSRLIHTLDKQGLPPRGLEYRLAHHFLAKPDAPTTLILYQLVGKPRRFGELREAIGAKYDNTVTSALETLRDEGVVDQRLDASKDPAVYWYELNDLGLQVFGVMQALALIEAERKPLRTPHRRVAHA